MNAYAVIDIGGTAIKYGCATEEGLFLEKASCPTQAREGGIPEKVIAIVQNMASRHALAGVAIDTAGIVRPGEDGAFTLLSNELIEDEGNILPEYESAFD